MVSLVHLPNVSVFNNTKSSLSYRLYHIVYVVHMIWTTSIVGDEIKIRMTYLVTRFWLFLSVT